MNEQSLEASHATLIRAEVGIRMLHVGKKQMTQAVFRQLVESSPFYEYDEGVGILEEVNIWGWVNYFPNKRRFKHREKDDDIFNLIYEYKGQLFRYEFRPMYGEKDYTKRELIRGCPQLFIAV